MIGEPIKTQGQQDLEGQVKTCLDNIHDRAAMSYADQVFLVNAGVPAHAPIPDDVAARLPSRKGVPNDTQLSPGEMLAAYGPVARPKV
jgi:hypothetical protein